MSVDRMANRINPNNIEMIRQGAQRAAEWVRDANIKNKWDVKYWDIGNEVWIWLFPEEYARFVVEYSKAMKAVDPTIKIIAGYEGIICGLSAFYAAIAQVLNEVYGRVVLPVCPVARK